MLKPSNQYITGFYTYINQGGFFLLSDDTISAVATAVGEGGIGIVRLSGDNALNIANKLFSGTEGKTVFGIASYHCAYGHIIDPSNDEFIDEVIILVMRSPRSYTREDVVEIHCHGGSIPLRKILSLTLSYGARLAEPGEFTKRAFLNGRLDLTQAEAVMDVIRAKTDVALRMAMSHLSGNFSIKIHDLSQKLLQTIAHVEASIDFPEDDIEHIVIDEVLSVTNECSSIMEYILSSSNTGRILRDGLKTVIIGKPNVGKSSLLNAILRENRAIVTNVPGTTRDVIEEYANIKGVPLCIVDTAGIRETVDIVEKIGVEKAREKIETADLVLLLFDASEEFSTEDRMVLRFLNSSKCIVVLNKMDLPQKLSDTDLVDIIGSNKMIKISVLQNLGIDELEDAIVSMVYSGQIDTESAFINNVRHIELLRQAKYHLDEVQRTIMEGMPLDCVTIDLRSSWEKLGEITGDTVSEDIINHIFEHFCIGK